MKIENLSRAVKAEKELVSLNKALEEANLLKDGFIISDYKDRSGSCIEYQYTNGEYHNLYKELKQVIIQKLQEAKDQLIFEIESL